MGGGSSFRPCGTLGTAVEGSALYMWSGCLLGHRRPAQRFSAMHGGAASVQETRGGRADV
eukprot:587673-Pyramimonas_sp.AAC.1